MTAPSEPGWEGWSILLILTGPVAGSSWFSPAILRLATGYVGCTAWPGCDNFDGSMDLDFNPLLAKADGTLPDLYLAKHSWDGSGDILVGGHFA